MEWLTEVENYREQGQIHSHLPVTLLDLNIFDFVVCGDAILNPLVILMNKWPVSGYKATLRFKAEVLQGTQSKIDYV